MRKQLQRNIVLNVKKALFTKTQCQGSPVGSETLLIRIMILVDVV